MINRTILSNFKRAVRLTPSSHQEIAWSLGIETPELHQILSGALKPTEKQEKEMIRFAFKSGALMKDDELINLVVEIVKSSKKKKNITKKEITLRGQLKARGLL